MARQMKRPRATPIQTCAAVTVRIDVREGGGERTCLHSFLKMMGSVPGPERVCLRKAKRTETTTTTSRDSRKTTKKTALVSYWGLYSSVVRGSVLLGTAKTLIAMVADYSTEIVVERERKEGGVHGGIGGRCGIFIMYVCGSGSGEGKLQPE
jgi:hypothetical protein